MADPATWAGIIGAGASVLGAGSSIANSQNQTRPTFKPPQPPSQDLAGTGQVMQTLQQFAASRPSVENAGADLPRGSVSVPQVAPPANLIDQLNAYATQAGRPS
jgi:hypothetical protein